MMVRVVHGIICSRIILDLRQAASPGDTFLTVSTGLIFAAPPWQRTNPTDMVLFETGGAQNENENFQGQTDEDFAVGQGVAL